MAKFYYGGQAVIEGVMMRGRTALAVGIRRPDNEMYVYKEDLSPALYTNKFYSLPFVRGVRLMWEMLVLGTRLMTLSANISSGAVDPAAAPVLEPSITTETSNAALAAQEVVVSAKAEKIGGAPFVVSLLVSLGLGVAIFFVGPLLLTSLLRAQIGEGLLNLIVEGVIRLILLVGYLYLIGRIPDIQRVFGYHGAEHKAINAMEHGDPLDVAHVRQASRVHTRCGTGFLLLVMVVSIFVFALIGSPTLLLKVLSRIVLVPVVAGIAYELMRLGAANYRFRVVRWLLAPGLALQGLTTREPDDSMIECAIAALKSVVARDEFSTLEIESPVLSSLAAVE